MSAVISLMNRVKLLEKENKKLKECAEFYSDSDNFIERVSKDPRGNNIYHFMNIVQMVKRANQAIKELYGS